MVQINESDKSHFCYPIFYMHNIKYIGFIIFKSILKIVFEAHLRSVFLNVFSYIVTPQLTSEIRSKPYDVSQEKDVSQGAVVEKKK